MPGRRLDPLGEVGKGMNGLGQIMHCGMGHHRRDDLMNYFASSRPGDMPAENLPAACIRDELDKTLGLGLYQCLPQRSYFDQRAAQVPTRGVGLFLGKTDTGDGRLGDLRKRRYVYESS